MKSDSDLSQTLFEVPWRVAGLVFQTYRIVGMQIADVWRSISMSKWLQEDLRHRAERQAVSFEILILQENALKKSEFS